MSMIYKVNMWDKWFYLNMVWWTINLAVNNIFNTAVALFVLIMTFWGIHKKVLLYNSEWVNEKKQPKGVKG